MTLPTSAMPIDYFLFPVEEVSVNENLMVENHQVQRVIPF